MQLADEDRDPVHRIAADLVEGAGRVPDPEVPGPAPQERIDVLHDHLGGDQQTRPGREGTDSVTSMLGRPT